MVGEGYHQQVGGPTLRSTLFDRLGSGPGGATLYVTLEPCNHHGRTPPCSVAVIEAGVKRVVACHRDPFPEVAGRGFARLEAAGIEVEVGHLAQRAVRLNWQFLVTVLKKRPAVTLKWAMSLDGRIATSSGESQWISSPGGRRWGLDQREVHDAILVGSNTALEDNPSLNRRLGKAVGPNVRVVLDRRLRLRPSARLFEIPGEILVYSESTDRRAVAALEARGAQVVSLKSVEPRQVLADLFARGVRSVLVEGGGTIAAAFVAAGCFDRLAMDCAPLLIGGDAAPGPLRGAGTPSLSAAPRLADLKVQRRDGDLIISGFEASCLQDLYASVDI